MPLTIRIALNLLGGLAALLGLGICSPAMAQVTVPVVRCTGNFSPAQTPLPDKSQFKIDAPALVAAQLELYYVYPGMMLGPRGWRCERDTGEGVFAFVVTLLPPDETDQAHGIAEVSLIDAGSYDSPEELYHWVNAYFPDAVQHEADMGYGPPTTASLKTYPTDKINYLPSLYITSGQGIQYPWTWRATYRTPANHVGVGTEILFWFGHDLFGPGDDGPIPRFKAITAPIQGILKLINGGGGGGIGWTRSLGDFIAG